MVAKIFLLAMAGIATPFAVLMLTSLQYAPMLDCIIGVTSLIAAIIGFLWSWKNSDRIFYVEEYDEEEEEEEAI